MEDERLQENLDSIDQSILFLLVIIAGIFLSFRSLLLQREGLAEGKQADIYPLRAVANSLIVGALGFFLCQTRRALCDAHDPVEFHSGQSNVLATLLVFCAAVVRLDDIHFLHEKKRL